MTPFESFVNMSLPRRPHVEDKSESFSTLGHKSCAKCPRRFIECFVNGETMGVAWTGAIGDAPCILRNSTGTIIGRTDEFATMRLEYIKKINPSYEGDVESVRFR
jgi:hypothetical protein